MYTAGRHESTGSEKGLAGWFLLGLLFAAGATASTPAPSPATSTANHVLLMLIDDLGFADVSYHGKLVGSQMFTPTIDKLSAQGVRLEQYYVTFLCSPTRTSLLSGRYPYTIGMNAEVITDGHASCMPSSVATIGDRLSAAGWATAAYGKWDCGMTSWGCTPTCRGFGHFFGFYNAFNDYFTHKVGSYLDLRNDTTPARDFQGDYFTEIVTAEAQRWLAASVQAEPRRSTFSYLAHQSNHGPLQVPQRYIDGECAARIPIAYPGRRIICGMMTAVDNSLANMTHLYKSLGIWEKTVIIFSTDNGGPTDEGGSNAPLRGQKATSYEGGVRGVGWIGGGLAAVQRGAVSRALIHVSDWYPTIVHGIAGLEVGVAADGTPPLDGLDAWPSILSASVPSARTEMLLQLTAGTQAIRVGKHKLIKGLAGGPASKGTFCTPHDANVCAAPKCYPYNISIATSAAVCKNGWVPAPESGKLPEPPPEVDCPAVPCAFPNSSYASTSTILLFDLEADPTERDDLSEQQPALRQKLLARLQFFVDKNITQDKGRPDPASNPKNFGGVWTPWVGDPNPARCTEPPPGLRNEAH